MFKQVVLEVKRLFNFKGGISYTMLSFARACFNLKAFMGLGLSILKCFHPKYIRIT